MPYRIRYVAALCLIVCALGACTQFEKSPPPLTRRVAVFDFRIASHLGNQPAEYRSYWFGAHTVFENRRDGAIFADELAEALTSLDYLSQHSRADVRYYMKTKVRTLMKEFPNLESEEYYRLLDEVSPLDFALELGVDEAIVGRIVEGYMSEHHTLHTWHSYLEVEVDVWDVSAGEVVWTRRFKRKKHFTSKPGLMEIVARDVARALDEDYYRD